MVLKFFLKNFTNLFFAISIVLSVLIAAFDFLDQSSDLYLTFVATAFFLYLSQIFIIYLKNKRSQNQNAVGKALIKPKSFTNFFILPIISAFVIYQLAIWGITVGELAIFAALGVVIVFLIFMNFQESIRKDDSTGLEIDESFDLMKLLTLFLLTLLTIRIILFNNFLSVESTIPLICYLLFFSMTITSDFKDGFLFNTLVSLVITIVFMISLTGLLQLNITRNVEILLATFQTIQFFIYLSIYQHSQDSSIDRKGLIKYLFILSTLLGVIIYLAA